MSQLIVRNVNPSVVQALKRRAASQGISAEEAHRRLLGKALAVEEDGFPDLKALLLAMPEAGLDADFDRVREMPRRVDLS